MRFPFLSRALCLRKNCLIFGFTTLGAVLLLFRESALADDAPRGEAAWRLFLGGDSVGARAHAIEALEVDSTDARAIVCVIRAAGDTIQDDIEQLFESTLNTGSPGSDLALGAIARERGETRRADSLLTIAVDRYRERGNPRGVMVAVHERALLHHDTGQSEAAAEDYQAALVLAREAALDMEIVFLSLNLGNAWIDIRRNEDAEPLMEFVVREGKRLGLWRWVGDAEISLSVLDRWQMRLDEALEHRVSALEAYRKASYAKGEARALHYVSVIHLFKGELTLAMQRLEEAYEACVSADYPSEAGRCLSDMGAVYYYLGEHEHAVAKFTEAIETGAEGNPRRWLAGAYSNLAISYLELGLFQEAIATSEKALPISREEDDRRGEARILGNWGYCLCEMGRHEEGIAKLDEGIVATRDWAMHADEAHFQMLKAACRYDRGDIDGTALTLEEAGALLESERFFQIQSPILQMKAAVHRARGNYHDALASLDEAIALIEGVRRRTEGASSFQSSYFGEQISIYGQMISLLHEMHRANPDEGFAARAFEVAQRAKSRSFLDLLTETQTDLRYRADPAFRKREGEILAEVVTLVTSDDLEGEADAKIAALEEELHLLEAKIREADPRYAELQYPQPIRLADVQQSVLAEDDLLLEYFLGEEASYLWSVSRDGIRFVEIADRATLAAALSPVSVLLSDYNRTGPEAAYYAAPVRTLSRLLLGPIQEELHAARHLIVAPHGPLFYLPFEALLTLDDRDALAPANSFRELPFLVRRFDVTYVPSIAAHARLGPRPAENQDDRGDVLIIGDPVLPEAGRASILAEASGAGDLSSLAHARNEIESIRALFEPDRTAVLAGAEATVEALRNVTESRRFRRIHFATHGVFNERRPVLSGLVLSSDAASGSEGFLAAGDVFALDLSCDQVVLSSCSSALGESVTGEGIVGMARAFLHAGARSVVAALWDVSDESSATFMVDYYRSMHDRPTGNAAAALADAKRRMIDGAGRDGTTVDGPDRAHPYFWAAFLLIGSAR